MTGTTLGSVLAIAQGLTPADDAARASPLAGTGLRGFADVRFLLEATFSLSLAAFLSWISGLDPRGRRTVDTLEEAEAPKLYVVYAVVGALIGLIVLRYGMVVGLVIFGIGGLLRFRSELASAPETGRLILVTLVGLTCGLDLPHLAVLTTVFGIALASLLGARVTYRVEVKGLEPGVVSASADAYRTALARHGCHVLSEKKNFAKDQVTFLFRAPRRVARDGLARDFEAEIPGKLRGAIDWEIG